MPRPILNAPSLDAGGPWFRSRFRDWDVHLYVPDDDLADLGDVLDRLEHLAGIHHGSASVRDGLARVSVTVGSFDGPDALASVWRAVHHLAPALDLVRADVRLHDLEDEQ